MQKSIATFWPPFPPTDCVVQSSFEITLFLLKHILPHYSLARLSHWRKDCLAHDQSQNFLGHQSLPLLCSPNILYHMYCLADGCKMQSHVTKWLSLGYSWPSVSTGGSRIVAFKLLFSNRPCWTKVLVSKEWRCWVETRRRITAGCSSQLDLAFAFSKPHWHCVGGWR